ncbi:MAG TPA: alpha/beta hydrolase [Micropepsaceae bacterium]|nr:alpha/beta hydrolase [Micropepsaceae bacterium]
MRSSSADGAALHNSDTTAMPLDPTVQALFQQVPQFAAYPMWEKSPEEARLEFKALCQFADPKAAAIGKIEDIETPGPAGPIPLRIYTPVAAGGEALPAIVYFHGGGFVLGDRDCYDGLCRALANESGSRVISVDYRLAPEHPFPAGVEDCFAATKWVEENAPDLGVDPNRLAVAGDSAGGNLAAVVCLLAKENKTKPAIAFQLLIYPVTRVETGASTRPFGTGYLLENRTIDWFRDHYLPKGTDLSDPRLSPLEAKDVSGLPPAYIVTAGFDPLHDEAIAYAEKLKEAGVKVSQVDYPTMIHGFFSMQGLIPLSVGAIAAAAHAVRDVLK